MTATEKYNSVLEGSMAKGEFLRQMKQAFPNYLTVSNGFDDSVQILKNRGMISENQLKDIRHIKSPEDNFSLTSIDRGVNYELNKAGIDSSGVVTKEQYIKARQQTILNLQKDQAFYYNLMAGESAKVDKHDKMKETKRGAKDADTFNAMKKATLKEDVDPSLDPYEDKKEIVRQVIDLVKREKSVPTSVAIDFIKTHYEDIINLRDDQAILDEFEEFFSVNYESGTDYMQEDEEEYLDAKDAAIKKAMGKEDEVEEEMDAAQMDAIKNYTPGSMDERPHEYKPGDMFSTDFDYEGMLKAGLKVRINTPIDVMNKIYDSFEDVNYHRENRHLGDVMDALNDGDRAEATEALKRYRKEIKETLSGIFEGAFPMRERDESYVPRNGEALSERVGSLQEFISLIEDRAENNDTTGAEEAEEVVYAIGDHYNFGVDIMQGPDVDRHDVGVPKIDEKKGKDHDKDGDVDGDDYMAAKDKAIKKAMKENVRAIINKVLKEDKAINEAATNQLAKFAEDYAGFEGMKGAILDLQNIVTDIEAYYDKTREKIQKVYDTLGEIRNEEGLKVGGFLAPAIETAFSKDLRPVTKTGFLKGLDTPKVRTISSAEIDAAKKAQGLDEFETAPAPKSNVFAPLRESSYGKNKKKK